MVLTNAGYPVCITIGRAASTHVDIIGEITISYLINNF